MTFTGLNSVHGAHWAIQPTLLTSRFSAPLGQPMRAAISPFAADLGCTDSDRPDSTRSSVDDSDEHDDEATVRAWADDIAERVVNLWTGRAEVTPIASTLREAGERSRGQKRRS